MPWALQVRTTSNPKVTRELTECGAATKTVERLHSGITALVPRTEKAGGKQGEATRSQPCRAIRFHAQATQQRTDIAWKRLLDPGPGLPAVETNNVGKQHSTI